MSVRIKHWRYRGLDRLRHSSKYKSWFAEQSERLGKTEKEIETLLRSGMTSTQIENTAAPETEPQT